MPLSFLNPALLFGTLAASLPVIIHFLSRRRVQRRFFSDLRFLDEVQARQARSLGIRRWLLLLLRVLILLLVALGVAGPRWGGLAVGGGRAVLFVVDTSASMATQTAEGTRLDEARLVTADMIASLPPGAAVQVLTAGGRVETVFSDWLPAGAGAEQGLAAVVQEYGVFDLDAVLEAAARQAARAPTAGVEVVIVSDLQRGPMPDPRGLARSAGDRLRLLVRQVGEGTAGGGVQRVRPPARVLVAGERVEITATVIPGVAGEVFTLDLDGFPVAEAAAAGQSGSPVDIVFTVTVPAPGLHRGRVLKAADTFPIDDQRSFVLAVPARVDVLLAHGTDRPGDRTLGRGGWRVLAAALAPGREDLFRLRAVSTDRLTTAAVGAADLTVLVDPDPLGRQIRVALQEDLAQGGSLLVAAGDPAQADYLSRTLLPLLELPARAVWRTAQAPGRRGQLGAGADQLLADLGEDALTTLEDVSWRRWFQVPAGRAEVVLSTGAGSDPLILMGEAGEGRWGLLAFNLLPEAGDLPGSPMALPLLRRIATHLARPPELAAAADVLVGDPLRIRPLSPRGEATFAAADALALVGPEPRVRTTAALEFEAGQPVLDGGRAAAPGFGIFLADTDTVGLVACGLDPRESIVQRTPPAAWGARLSAVGLDFAGNLTGLAAGDLAESFAGRSLAPWFFMAAFVLLAVELQLGRGVASSG